MQNVWQKQENCELYKEVEEEKNTKVSQEEIKKNKINNWKKKKYNW